VLGSPALDRTAAWSPTAAGAAASAARHDLATLDRRDVLAGLAWTGWGLAGVLVAAAAAARLAGRRHGRPVPRDADPAPELVRS
jgi:hypothetical protein